MDDCNKVPGTLHDLAALCTRPLDIPTPLSWDPLVRLVSLPWWGLWPQAASGGVLPSYLQWLQALWGLQWPQVTGEWPSQKLSVGPHGNRSWQVVVASALRFWACELPEPQMLQPERCDALHNSKLLCRVWRCLRPRLQESLGGEWCHAQGCRFCSWDYEMLLPPRDGILHRSSMPLFTSPQHCGLFRFSLVTFLHPSCTLWAWVWPCVTPKGGLDWIAMSRSRSWISSLSSTCSGFLQGGGRFFGFGGLNFLKDIKWSWNFGLTFGQGGGGGDSDRIRLCLAWVMVHIVKDRTGLQRWG